jgi:hypothetical protein
MNHERPLPAYYVSGGRVRPCQRPPIPARHQPYQPDAKYVLKDTGTVNISAGRLRRWYTELQALEKVRNAIKSLSVNDYEKTKLLALTTQVRVALGSVKGEMRNKLRA